jgi:1,4-alpha-glucan branching enzyme
LQIVLSSDEAVFGGWENVSKKFDVEYQTQEGNYDNRPHSMLVYSPSRTVAVYAKTEFCDATADESITGIPGLGVKGRGPHWQC